MIDPAVGTLLAAAFALLFASAALHKLLDLEHFAEVVRAYAVVPPVLSRLWWLVPLAELGVAAGLLASPAHAAVAGTLLLVAYGGVIAINLHRGRHDLSCGCGGANERRPIAAWMVWRNMVLAAALSVLRLPWAPRPLGAVDLLTIMAGTLVAALLYMSADMLLARVAPRTALLRGSS